MPVGVVLPEQFPYGISIGSLIEPGETNAAEELKDEDLLVLPGISGANRWKSLFDEALRFIRHIERQVEPAQIYSRGHMSTPGAFVDRRPRGRERSLRFIVSEPELDSFMPQSRIS